MNKEDFLNTLQELIPNIPKSEQARTLVYYDEIINDYIDDGLTEFDAVEKLGDLQVIANGIISDYVTENNIPLDEKQTKPNTHTSNKALIIILAISAVVWVPLLLAFGVMVIVIPFAVIVALVSAVIALVIAIVFIIGTIPATLSVSMPLALLYFGAILICLCVGGLISVLVCYLFKWGKKSIRFIMKKIFKRGKSI